MKSIKTTFIRGLSLLLALVLILNLPISAFAATEDGIEPYAYSYDSIRANMMAHPAFAALKYLGYDSEEYLETNGLLFTSGYYGGSLNHKIEAGTIPNCLTPGISYSSVGSGMQTSTTSTGYTNVTSVTGKYPNVKTFESTELDCVDYITYYLTNYLPNIEGADTSVISDAMAYLQANGHSYNSRYDDMYFWDDARSYFVKNGVKVYRATNVDAYSGIVNSYIDPDGVAHSDDIYASLPLGCLIQMGELTDLNGDGSIDTTIHYAIYAGTYNGTHFIYHCGNKRGPEISRVESMAPENNSGDKASVPLYFYVFPTEENYGSIEIYKDDPDGKPLAGAKFRVDFEDGTSVYITTGSDGYARLADLLLGTYTIREVAAPSGYLLDSTVYTVTLTKDNPTGGGTIHVTNRKNAGSLKIIKNILPSTAANPGNLAGWKFTVHSNYSYYLPALNANTNGNSYRVRIYDKEPLIFLKIWRSAAPHADRDLLERAAAIAERLTANHISASIMEDEEILHLCRIYAELGVWQAEKIETDIPILPGFKRLFSRKPSPEEVAEAELLEQITPVGGLVYKPTSLMVGSSYCKCYGATRYPAGIDFGWAVRLMGATDCITCITYYPGNEAEIGDALSRSIRASNRDAESESDIRTKKRFQRKAKDADKLIDKQDAEGMALGHMSIVTMPFADTPEKLEEICKEVIARFGRKQIKLRLLAQLQKDAFKHISPYHPDQLRVNDVLKRIIPLETVVGGYPCTVNTLRDDHGVYFARTPDQSIVSMDVRIRNGDRTNGNGITTGIPGIGKSTMLKHIMESFYMQGIKIIAFDPERECRTLCKNLGGSWWDAGGGNAKINLLQIQASFEDDEEDAAYRSTSSPLSEHIQYVQTILRYKIPSLTDVQLALLARALRELYAKFGITLNWKFDPNRIPEEYPIMEDLYHHLQEQAKDDARYEELALLLEDMAIGADSMIWNGHTNIDLSADIVVIDTNRLYNSSDRNRAAQYYNLMRMAFTKVSADRTTPYAIFADEAQTLFDPELPSAAMALRNIALRIRKYEGYLWLSFHSLHELLDERIRLYGQPILDAATYKILFGTDGRNLADTVDLFKLTPAEEKVLEARQRGKALALIGSQHLKVEFVLPVYKLQLMGTGGGR